MLGPPGCAVLHNLGMHLDRAAEQATPPVGQPRWVGGIASAAIPTIAGASSLHGLLLGTGHGPAVREFMQQANRPGYCERSSASTLSEHAEQQDATRTGPLLAGVLQRDL